MSGTEAELLPSVQTNKQLSIPTVPQAHAIILSTIIAIAAGHLIGSMLVSFAHMMTPKLQMSTGGPQSNSLSICTAAGDNGRSLSRTAGGRNARCDALRTTCYALRITRITRCALRAARGPQQQKPVQCRRSATQ